MKRIFTLALMASLTYQAYGQITLDASNVPVASPTYNIDLLGAIEGAAIGPDQVWDYSSAAAANSTTNNFPAATNANFIAAGAETTFSYDKTAFVMGGNTIATTVIEQWDFSQEGLHVIGYFLPGGSLDLGDVGGVAGDSIGAPDQEILPDVPLTLMDYPVTANSAWSSVSTFNNPFWASIAQFNLDHTPMVQQITVVRTDSIVGWGEMTVYTSGGISIPYPVLMRRTHMHHVDSLLVDGAPASQDVLDFFGFVQGNINSIQNFDDFIREDMYRYLIRVFYGGDNTFSTVAQVQLCTDNLETLGVNDGSAAGYSVMVYPNPTDNGTVNLNVIGRTLSGKVHYSVSDLAGRTVQTGTLEAQAGSKMSIVLGSEIANGNYNLTVTDKSGSTVVNQKLSVQR